MADEKKNTEEKKNNDLIEAGLKSYGIDKKHVLKTRIDNATGEAVIVTVGGAKVRYAEGMEVKPLDPIRVDGVIRKKMKPITGGKKK